MQDTSTPQSKPDYVGPLALIVMGIMLCAAAIGAFVAWHNHTMPTLDIHIPVPFAALVCLLLGAGMIYHAAGVYRVESDPKKREEHEKWLWKNS